MKKSIQRAQHEIDASKYALGRLATRASYLLRGKHKTGYQPNIDGGDFVTVMHASQVRISGKKPVQKMYKHFSGYPGGLKERQYKDVQKKTPEFVIRHAVMNMLPDTRLRKAMLKRLKILP